jgi:RimJ/RimL family protein N-acetyltransferase
LLAAHAFPVIETARLVLRQARQEDAGRFLYVARDEAVMRYYGVEPFQVEQQALEELDDMTRSSQPSTFAQVARF